MATDNNTPLDSEELRKINAYWKATNYLAAGQIYLYKNPLLREKLSSDHIKPRLLGHWGTSPGLNFLYVHLNRIIKRDNLNLLFITGPGHGAPAIIANTYLEGTYSEFYPDVSQDENGMKTLFKQFSFPGGIPSHTSPETPGSIHEGGELGYCLAHAYGAVFDNPDLISVCVVGDGEAETGPLATSWHSNKFLNPKNDGAVLPILHLNGYKIAEATVLARISKEELGQLFYGYGYEAHFVEGDDPEQVHQQLAATLDIVFGKIAKIQKQAREENIEDRPIWPMIIFRTPKGWTCPQTIDGKPIENSWRSHQIPVKDPKNNPKHLKILEDWLRGYKPEELFDEEGKLIDELAALAPKGEQRMGANPHANGGLFLRNLKMPDFRDYAVEVSTPGLVVKETTRVMGGFLRDIMKKNEKSRNFRVFGPDETASNRLDALFEVTNRTFEAEIYPTDEHVAKDGRVMEILSEHLCQGWLEGYLLTGRHGFFSCYEAFIHIVDSMFNQHAKWLKSSKEVDWRRPIASLNYLLTSYVWRQDHNGFSHQDPGFIDHIMNKKASIVRIYLPPDANCLLSVTDHCLRSRDYVNLIIAGKQPEPQWLDMDQAIQHCTAGLGIWKWASTDEGEKPDVVLACAGSVPTIEVLAATKLLLEHFPHLKIRVVNVVNLMKLQPQAEHPHGLNNSDFDTIFPRNVHTIFAFHGYPSTIHKLTYKRTNYPYMHVRGYKEEGTTTTPFDMVVLNEVDRFHLAGDVVDRVAHLAEHSAYFKQLLRDKLLEHKEYIRKYGEDMPEIRNWKWQQ